jgi:very-short-patch-repair endonuclease
MRREPTPPERTLWLALRNGALNGFKFRRQQPIGRYIADFYCSQAKLVVEVDGATHATGTRDAARDAWLLTQGIRVLRVWNNKVMGNLPGVLATILAAAATPPPAPSHKGRGFSPRRAMFRRSQPT